MTEISADFGMKPDGGPVRARPRIQLLGAALGVLAAAPASAWLWGFTVDDALITARVATHLAEGLGARFNPHGPLVDAVTPLGYAQLLALFGRGDVLGTFRLAKFLGLGTWWLGAGLLGALLAATGDRLRRFSPLLIVAVCAPLGAWAGSGMETGIVTLLASVGLCGGPVAALSLGVAAAWRPELMPFALVLVLARSRLESDSLARSLRLAAFTALPSLVVASVRAAYFGRVVPLSFYAKPSDFAHGLAYALGGFAFTGLPWLVLATPAELKRISRRAWPLAAALGAHFAALVLCGGDWMALYRLVVPVLPCAALAGAYVAEQSGAIALLARCTVALAASLLLAWGLGAPARRVGEQRAALIAAARPLLAHDRRIAALDVGWVGAASDADVIDLAGVTDPEVAFFPGGHTSKRIPRAFLFARDPSAIVLLLKPSAGATQSFAPESFSRAVEQRVAWLVADDFRVRCTLPFGDQNYVVLEPTGRP